MHPADSTAVNAMTRIGQNSNLRESAGGTAHPGRHPLSVSCNTR